MGRSVGVGMAERGVWVCVWGGAAHSLDCQAVSSPVQTKTEVQEGPAA